MSCRELKDKMLHNPESIYILDVREASEWDRFNIGGNLIPMSEVKSRLSEIPHNKEVVVLCQAGIRSRKISEFLLNQDFKSIFNLKGGLVAWFQEFGS